MKRIKILLTLLVVIAMVLSFVGCGSDDSSNTSGKKKEDVKLSGEVRIDGSSTVYPITEAIAEEFLGVYPGVRVPVGVSGTGGGFKKFLINETDINDASRSIKDNEKVQAEENGIEYVEITVAYDGLSVMVNPQNDWVDYLTVDELKRIWEPGSTVNTWADVRDGWPAEEIKLYGPGADSGTFDYFTDEIVGEEGAIRTDYTPSEDDNVLIQGIAGDKYALGYFGYAYYSENKDKLKIVAVDNGNGAIEPTFETIQDGTYAPLSRPLFIYLNKASLSRPEVKAFVTFYLENAGAIAEDVGYVALPDSEYQKELSMIE